MKVLIIGLGSIARKHITSIRSLYPKCDILALRSSKLHNSEEGIINLYDPKDIPENIDFGIISSPTHLHLSGVDILLERNIPLFIEKPVFHQLDPCYEKDKKILSSGLTSYVACNLRFLNSLKYLKNYLENSSGRINEVNIYCGSYMPAWRGDESLKNYSHFENMGGGVHLDLFHEIDYACWLFGMPITNRNIFRKVSSLNIEAVDYANLNLIYKNFTCNITLNYFRKDPKRTVEIVFDNETLILDIFKNSVVTSRGNIIFEDNVQTVRDTYLAQMEYFISCLNNNISPENNFSQSVKILEICLSNYETFQ